MIYPVLLFHAGTKISEIELLTQINNQCKILPNELENIFDRNQNNSDGYYADGYARGSQRRAYSGWVWLER